MGRKFYQLPLEPQHNFLSTILHKFTREIFVPRLCAPLRLPPLQACVSNRYSAFTQSHAKYIDNTDFGYLLSVVRSKL